MSDAVACTEAERERQTGRQDADVQDVVIVGGGVSGTSTLVQLLRRTREARPTRPLRLTVVERSEDLYAGLPYGARSGSASLIVTPLRDFLEDGLRARFIAWLNEHRAEILRAEPGLSASWVDQHADAIRAGEWEELFIPRRLFGRFLRERTEHAIAEARRLGTAEVRSLRGEAVRVRGESEHRVVDVLTEDGAVGLAAHTVVLAVGSPPKQLLSRSGQGPGLFLDDTHAGDLDALLDDAAARVGALPPGMSRDVLLVGANADALELLHALDRRGSGAVWERRITVLSRRGEPDAWRARRDRSAEYISRHLAAYVEGTTPEQLTAAAVAAAVEADVAAALAAGFGEQDTVPELKRLTLGALDAMPWDQQQAFVDRYGMETNRFSRPTGGDYQAVTTRLLAEARLDMVAARYVRAESTPSGWVVVVADAAGERELPGHYGVIVNCAGFEPLPSTDDALLRSLQDSGLARVTRSAAGIEVDAHYRAAEHVFVAGPLLAGNLNEHLRLWHVESCRRILGMSREVADAVAADLGDRGDGTASAKDQAAEQATEPERTYA